MHIDDFDRVSQLRNYRRKYIELREAARSSYVFKIGDINVFGVLGADSVRNAVAIECDKLIRETELELLNLGVVLASRTAQTSAE